MRESKAISRIIALAGLVAGAGWLAGCVGCGDAGGATDGAPSDAAAVDAEPGACWLPCPEPSSGKNTLCGQVLDFETNQPIAVADPTGRSCEEIPAGERNGPCSMSVAIYDAIGFAQNPTGTQPLPVDSVTMNDCGRYVAVGIPTPALGYVAVAIDDAAGSQDDTWVQTANIYAIGPGDRLDRGLYAVAATTDVEWTATAGDPFAGETFATHGVGAEIYICGGEPLAGVQLGNDGGVDPAHDFYFSDSDPWTRSTIDPAQNVTGADGTVLLAESAVVDHTSSTLQCGSCVWEPAPVKAIPGLALVAEHIAVDDNGNPCGP